MKRTYSALASHRGCFFCGLPSRLLALKSRGGGFFCCGLGFDLVLKLGDRDVWVFEAHRGEALSVEERGSERGEACCGRGDVGGVG